MCTLQTKNKVKIEMKKRKEVDKYKDNVGILLTNSNATPIGRYGGIGYSCCYCQEQFTSPDKLKTHTIKEHDKTKSNFMANHTMLDFIVKLDITNLKCRICTDNQNSLEHLTEHLKKEHGFSFHENLKNHILPFKFDDDLMKCVICSNEFNNFKVLLEHMNSHYRNYVCDVCGNGYVTKRILQAHSYRHKPGEYKCSFCLKMFDTKAKHKDHERVVHGGNNKRSKCGYCGEKFSDYAKKHNHEVKMHGAKPVVLKCQACEKVFDNQRSLTVHVKSYHLMEKRLPKIKSN